jgi:serine/threonine-protein kinase
VVDEGNGGRSGSTSQRASADAYLKAAASGRAGVDPGVYPQMPPSGTFVPQPGEILADKYQVERLLGVGGMGVVVAARHLQLDLPVALKFMTDETVRDYSLVARFLAEARATARLRGEHVVRVSDVGELASGTPYMVMELLQGQDLGALLASLGPPPVESAVDYVIQACEGLGEAHRAGFVHRDVKPSNLFLTRRSNGTPCIKVVDFGISKAVTMVESSDALHATTAQAVFGSPLYMAPEQMRAARDVDARADIWSLGASLYELLTGNLPFEAKSLVELAYRIANEPPPSIVQVRHDVSPGLERVVFRCLEKDRAHRFQDARSLAAALEPFRGGVRVVRADSEEATDDDETRLLPVDAPPGSPPRATESLGDGSVSWGRSQRFARIRMARRRPVAIAAALALAALGAAVVVFRSSAPPPPSAVVVPVAKATPIAAVEPLQRPVVSVDEPPTVSVTDLPTASVAPAPPPPVVVPATATALPPLPPASARPRPSSEPPAASAHAPPDDCSPPYYYDEVGLKIFKPECVN